MSNPGRVGVYCVRLGLPPGGLVVGVWVVLDIFMPGAATGLFMISPAEQRYINQHELKSGLCAAGPYCVHVKSRPAISRANKSISAPEKTLWGNKHEYRRGEEKSKESCGKTAH